MTQFAILLLLTLCQAPPEQALLDQLRLALDSSQESKLVSLFVRKADSDALLEMAGRTGVRGLRVNVIPTPPGWGSAGDHWAVFHKRQGIESFHDMVFRVAVSPEGLLVGAEVPETDTGGWKVTSGRFDAVVMPDTSTVNVKSALQLQQVSTGRAPVFRLGDTYSVSSVASESAALKLITCDDRLVPKPNDGDAVRAGGILVIWSSKPRSSVSVDYSGVVADVGGGDKINKKVCYLTAWWTPTISRQPYTTSTRIEAPKEWVFVSEGVEVPEISTAFAQKSPFAGNAVKCFRCDVAISFPKIVGGLFKLALEGKDAKGRTFRSYQLDPVEPDRAKKDVDLMMRAAAFYDDTLGPWPFPGYACFDGDTYYGIESYSYTLLLRPNTTRFVAHEMGHTYFGGVVPNSYTRDCWNESLTQYVESELFSKDADKSLEKGLATVNVAVPMSKMSRPGLFGSATYYRGAYVMTMLQNEIGLDKVVDGMKAIVKERKGIDTTWPELRPYFEKTAGAPLDWFWKQWVEGATFPKLEVIQARTQKVDNGWKTSVVVKQSGTPAPFRLRFNVAVSTLGDRATKTVTMDSPQAAFEMQTTFKPTSSNVEVFGLCLATVGAAISPTP